MANGLPPTPTEALPPVTPPSRKAVASTQGSEPTGAEAAPAMPVKRGVIHINGDTRDRWLAVLQQMAPEGTSQHAKMAVLLERLEAQLQGDDRVTEQVPSDEAATAVAAKADVPESVESNPVKEQTINYQAQTLAWLTTEVEQLRRQVTQLQAKRETVAANAQPTPALEAELVQLRAENVQLRQAQAQLEAFRQLLTNGNGQEAVTEPALTTTVAPTAVVSGANSPLVRCDRKPILQAKFNNSFSAQVTSLPPLGSCSWWNCFFSCLSKLSCSTMSIEYVHCPGVSLRVMTARVRSIFSALSDRQAAKNAG